MGNNGILLVKVNPVFVKLMVRDDIDIPKTFTQMFPDVTFEWDDSISSAIMFVTPENEPYNIAFGVEALDKLTGEIDYLDFTDNEIQEAAKNERPRIKIVEGGSDGE